MVIKTTIMGIIKIMKIMHIIQLL